MVGWNNDGSTGRVVGRASESARSAIRDEGMMRDSSGTVRRCRRMVGRGRKLRKARNGVRAIAISGLWLLSA